MANCVRGCCCWFFCFLIAFAIIGISYIAMRRKMPDLHPDAPPVPGAPGPINQKYSDALQLATQFFEIQKSGKLEKNKIPWRGDSALKDGSEVKADLSKGMYDAGDNMKFNFPMAFTATVLSWAILEYGDQMGKTKQLEPAKDSLKWITDYLINCHPSPNVLYIQVGDPVADHECWQKPEAMTEPRPVTQVNTTSPGTEVAAETAAAMASASLVFRKSDLTYSDLLVKHAGELFTFADTYKASYSVSVPEVQRYYNSTGYGDELIWAASWLYHATEDDDYLKYVMERNVMANGNLGKITWFSWDNKHAGAQILLSRVSFFNGKKSAQAVNLGLQAYMQTAVNLMCSLLPYSPSATDRRTESGLIWISEWSTLQYSIGAAFLALIYSDYMLTSETGAIYCGGKLFTAENLRSFATSQADYVLGNNPMNMSYLVGYGDKYPEFVHHRGASIPKDVKSECKDIKWLESKKPNPNVAVGAVVGGPFLNESYTDDRNNSMQAEPTTYNSAMLVGLLSGLLTRSSVVESFH